MKKRNIYILKHVYHLYNRTDEKIIGAYSSKKEAQSAIDRLKDKPGFKEHPVGFQICKYEINEDNWVNGFVSSSPEIKVEPGGKIIYEEPYYFMESDSGKTGPFCKQCYENSKETIKLIEQKSMLGLYHCHKCDSWFGNPYLGKSKWSKQVDKTIKIH